MKRHKKIELLSPAGNLSKMKYAFQYGADAVYLGIPDFSLRVRINQFKKEEILEAVKYAHKLKKKVYVTLNIYAHNRHLDLIIKHLKFLKKTSIDAVIVSDPGIINLVKRYLPRTDIHLSTQANATNFEAVKFWRDLGVKRIILAREVSLEEIKEIKKKVKNIELEVFVHGAMCMSYSGRCILSKWISNRSANLGDCTQPCRWEYHKTCNMEHETKKIRIKENLKGYEMDIEEDRHGTYFFNSYDLNLIEYIKDLIEAGVTSFKIEGRAKSAYYVAVATRAYRKVINAILSKKSQREINKKVLEQKKELDNLANRGYWTGFLLGDEPPHNFSGKMNKGRWEFIGEILNNNVGTDFKSIQNRLNILKIHNAVFKKDEIEVVMPEKNISVKIKKILNDKKQEIQEAHGGHEKLYYFEFNKFLSEGSLIRRRI